MRFECVMVTDAFFGDFCSGHPFECVGEYRQVVDSFSFREGLQVQCKVKINQFVDRCKWFIISLVNKFWILRMRSIFRYSLFRHHA